MGISKSLSCDQAKQMDLVDYLDTLGYNPSKIRNTDYWYLSPFRDEKTASFKIDRRKNVWFDHGSGQGGSLIDFGILYHNCSIKELLEKLNSNSSFHQQPPITIISEKKSAEKLLKIISEKQIGSLSLLRYLTQRRIALEVANKYCREVNFHLNGKTLSAIGFRNDEGGYELRNQWFKGSSSPKAVTSVQQEGKDLSVFEGFFNFLSHQTIHQNQQASASNFLILNSASFFEKSRPLMEQYNNVRLFLDRDKTGQNCTLQALSWSKRYTDESKLYEGYKDLNEWMHQIGKSEKQKLHHSIK